MSNNPRITEIVTRMSEMSAGTAAANWSSLSAELIDLRTEAVDEADWVTLITAREGLMSFAEGLMSEADVHEFRENRLKSYRLLIISECADEKGLVVPDKLLHVTSREVRAGRMEPDDELHTLAEAGATVIGAGIPDAKQVPKKGFWRRLFG